ncbi:MAG: DUF4397 domain-containing protein [Betaproteobacteria bacterium]
MTDFAHRPRPLRRRAALAALALPAVAALPGCGGGTDRRRAHVRLVNTSTGNPQLELRVDDELKHAAVAYGERAAYAEVDPDEPETTVFATGSPTALLRFSPAYANDRWFTVLAYGPAGALRALTLDDNRGEPDANRAVLRVVNAAADAGALDLYLTTETEELATAVPLQSGAAYGSVGDWQTVASGRWRLRATAAGSKADVRLDLPAVDLASRAIGTLVLSSSAGGVLVDALLLTQRGAITPRANAQARVRLAALLTDSASVTASLGAVALGSGVGSPAVADYVRVAAGPVVPAVAVNGVALAVPALTLQPGRDHTLLLAGTPAAPRVVLITDDNTLPRDTARAKLRLVNALADAGLVAAMTLDFSPVGGEVAAGAASEAALVVATLAGRIAVTVRGATAPLFVATEQVVRAGGVHTVFVAGAAAAAVGILRRDR